MLTVGNQFSWLLLRCLKVFQYVCLLEGFAYEIFTDNQKSCECPSSVFEK